MAHPAQRRARPAVERRHDALFGEGGLEAQLLLAARDLERAAARIYVPKASRHYGEVIPGADFTALDEARRWYETAYRLYRNALLRHDQDGCC